MGAVPEPTVFHKGLNAFEHVGLINPGATVRAGPLRHIGENNYFALHCHAYFDHTILVLAAARAIPIFDLDRSSH